MFGTQRHERQDVVLLRQLEELALSAKRVGGSVPVSRAGVAEREEGVEFFAVGV